MSDLSAVGITWTQPNTVSKVEDPPSTGNPFPNLLSEFIYTRTYSRWLTEKGRRETWPETVQRYIDFISEGRDIPRHIRKEIHEAILRMEVLPSMRALWAAGAAAKRDNICLYNCSFVPMDCLYSFSEILYILMQGTGVGFSVERQFVGRLPVVEALSDTRVSFCIEDSTEGWTDALRFGVQQWWKGYTVDFDYSKIRPAGAPLKTKGGRASGPRPLRKLMEFAQNTIHGAAGRKLRPLEVHDICCQIAEIVMVGGFRRAALISFSDPDDTEIRHAKDWTRGNFPAIRYLSNNSAFYKERPSEEMFWSEWSALVNSKSGERGFSIDSWHQRADRPKGMVRSNPCVTGDTRVMTEGGMVQIRDLAQMVGTGNYKVSIDRRFNQGVWATPNIHESNYAFKTGTKEVFTLKTTEGYNLRLTADHRVMTSDGWKEAQHLEAGDIIHIANTEGMFGTRGNADAGMLGGWITGDGCLLAEDNNSPRLYFFGADRHLIDQMLDAAERLTGRRPSVSVYEKNERMHFECAALREYLGQIIDDKFRVPEFVWQGTEDCQRSYLSALFSADGSVQGTREKGVSVRLASSKIDLLHDVQMLLLNFGIASKVYEERRPAGYRDLPDGKGGYKSYLCNADHELIISKINFHRFADRIGFIHQEKQAKLAAEMGGRTRGFYKEPFTARFESLTPAGVEDVYDMTVPVTHSFVANGLVVHNCGEIGLRFAFSEDPITGEGGAGSFCNLTSAVMRITDTRESMARKVRLATWLGVVQSTFTYFPYLRKGWAEICEQDRLLGVDITGQCDNPKLSTDPEVMSYLNLVARQSAAEASSYMGINMPVALACGKPSGNSSQMVDCASGFHSRFAPYYFRHVRISASDPLFKMVRDAGVPVLKENGQEHLPDNDVTVWVVRFPVKAPKEALFRHHETALQQCNRYLQVMDTWIGKRGHNQSATVYVHEHEWEEVGQWVWENFERITGLTFLPYDGGNYTLAPYQEITEEEYDVAVSKMPKVDFGYLSLYERTDRGEGGRELACSGGSCEL